MRRFSGCAVVALLTACGIRNPVANTIVVQPGEDRRHVTVTVRTVISNESDDPLEKERLSELRAAIVDRRDPWTARFAAVTAESEHFTWEKSNGSLRSAEHSAKIRLDDLQRFLSDCGTIQITDGERWTEMALYPSSSARATRQQRERVLSAMHTWAVDAVRYFRALDDLYSYLDREPKRATPVFTILLSDKQERSVIEEEDALLTAVSKAMNQVIDDIDHARREGLTLDEQFDLVFNPLPAEIVVRLPKAVISFEGFERRDDHTLAIPRNGLIDAIASLEGRWASPDPLAILGHAADADSEGPKAAEVAERPRRSSATVTADEIEKALAARLRPATMYRVRW